MTAQTVVDEVDRTFLVLRVAAAQDGSSGEGCGTRWCAHVCDPASPLAGLYAFADTIAEARDAVAMLAWTAVMAGELLPVRPERRRPRGHPHCRDDEHGLRRVVADGRRRQRRGVGGAMTTEQSDCQPRLVSEREDEPYSSWVRRARCVGRADVFADESRSDDALAICGACPVRRQCRRWALANAVDGVAGGMTLAERVAWRKEVGHPEPVVAVEDFLGAELASADRTWGRPLGGDPERGGAVDRRR